MTHSWTNQPICLPPIQTAPMDEWVRYVWVPNARLTTDITQAAELRALLTQSTPRPPLQQGAADAATLFWFRWITGHQISFAAWILAVDVIDQANRGSMARLDAQIRCHACLRWCRIIANTRFRFVGAR